MFQSGQCYLGSQPAGCLSPENSLRSVVPQFSLRLLLVYSPTDFAYVTFVSGCRTEVYDSTGVPLLSVIIRDRRRLL